MGYVYIMPIGVLVNKSANKIEPHKAALSESSLAVFRARRRKALRLMIFYPMFENRSTAFVKFSMVLSASGVWI